MTADTATIDTRQYKRIRWAVRRRTKAWVRCCKTSLPGILGTRWAGNWPRRIWSYNVTKKVVSRPWSCHVISINVDKSHNFYYIILYLHLIPEYVPSWSSAQVLHSQVCISAATAPIVRGLQSLMVGLSFPFYLAHTMSYEILLSLKSFHTHRPEQAASESHNVLLTLA